ncbi:MAG: hypothetical protein AB3A66_06085 [Nodularia sp. CChRGM 3473]
MNYQKLDAPLAVALNDAQNSEEQSLNIFIHTEPIDDSNATTVLESLGVTDVTPGRDVFTATLSPNAISQLSEQSWVKHLRLSQKLHLVNQRKSMGGLRI